MKAEVIKKAVRILAVVVATAGYIRPVLPAEKQAMTFQQFIEAVQKNDPRFRQILVQKLYLKYARDLQVPASDLVLEVEGQYGFLQTDTLNGDFGVGASLKKTFASTGTEIELGYNKRANFSQVFGPTTTLGVRLSQSVLNNSFGSATRKLEQKVEVNTAIARYQIIEAYEDYLAALLVLYLDWHSTEERYAAARKALDEEQTVYELIARRQKLRIAWPDEVARARLAVLEAEEALALARMQLDNRLLKIEGLSGIKAADLGSSTWIDFSKNFTLKPAEKDNRTEKILELMKKEGMLDVELAENDLLPSATLFAGYDLLSEEYNVTKPDHRFYFGGSFSLNFTRQKEKAARETALIKQKEIKLNTRSRLIDLNTDRRSVVNFARYAARAVELAGRRLETARERAGQMQKKYNLRQATITELADAREDLVEARLNLVEKKSLYESYKIEELRLWDSLVVRLPGKQSVDQ